MVSRVERQLPYWYQQLCEMQQLLIGLVVEIQQFATSAERRNRNTKLRSRGFHSFKDVPLAHTHPVLEQLIPYSLDIYIRFSSETDVAC